MLRQDFAGECHDTALLECYKNMARGYAVMENALAVLSDMRADVSHIYCGGFADTLALKPGLVGETCCSIWEEPILQLVHPDDLKRKYVQELQFFHFVRRQPKGRRGDYCCMSRLRMKAALGHYMPVMHRICYVPSPADGSMWLTLCLYTPLILDVPVSGLVSDTVTGQVYALEEQTGLSILSARERQILQLIDKGLMSKHIAEKLSISVNTVSRHRQEILSKLHVKSSIEACHAAKDLGIL